MDSILLHLLILLKLKKEDIKYDWLGFKITEDNYLTGHHIKSRSNGGEDSVDNMALLSVLSHRYLHECIELYDIDTYNKINNILKEACINRRCPNESEFQKLLYLMYKFEMENKSELKKKISNLKINPRVIKKFDGIIDISSVHGYRLLLQNGINPSSKHKQKTKNRR